MLTTKFDEHVSNIFFHILTVWLNHITFMILFFSEDLSITIFKRY